MAGLRSPVGKSGGRPKGLFAGFLPVERRQLFDFLDAQGGQTLQHILQISLRLDRKR